jgi:hypothetical protein
MRHWRNRGRSLALGALAAFGVAAAQPAAGASSPSRWIVFRAPERAAAGAALPRPDQRRGARADHRGQEGCDRARVFAGREAGRLRAPRLGDLRRRSRRSTPASRRRGRSACPRAVTNTSATSPSTSASGCRERSWSRPELGSVQVEVDEKRGEPAQERRERNRLRNRAPERTEPERQGGDRDSEDA